MRLSHSLFGRFGASAIAVLAAFFLTLSGQACAQGFDWSQLFGGGGTGGGGGQMHQHSGQPGGSGVIVERKALPFTGKFSGKQEDQGIENTMTAQFACYPASDSDIPQSKAFVCYSAPTNENGSAVSSPFRRAGGDPPAGSPNGPPPDIE